MTDQFFKKIYNSYKKFECMKCIWEFGVESTGIGSKLTHTHTIEESYSIISAKISSQNKKKREKPNFISSIQYVCVIAVKLEFFFRSIVLSFLSKAMDDLYYRRTVLNQQLLNCESLKTTV
uniref:Uncharacterized protein n=1 Tax=Cacopsylla melanoneura TaxID=428564 RepID=A0A8D8VGT4_9HEMI